MVPPTRTRRFPHRNWKRTASFRPTNCQEKVVQHSTPPLLFLIHQKTLIFNAGKFAFQAVHTQIQTSFTVLYIYVYAC